MRIPWRPDPRCQCDASGGLDPCGGVASRHPQHGQCGVKALHALHRAGVKVYSTDSTSIDDALEDLRQGNLREAQPA